MSRVIDAPPTHPTPFARTLGVETLGTFDPVARTYTLVYIPPSSVANFFGTAHGGSFLGLLDDAAGMLAFHLHGVNSAVTTEWSFRLHRGARPRKPYTAVVTLVEETDDHLMISGIVRSATDCIIDGTSIWLRRDAPRARSS